MSDNKRHDFLELVFKRIRADSIYDASIIEVGLIRDESEEYRIGDGHATQWFYDYVRKSEDATYKGFDIAVRPLMLCSERFRHPRMQFIASELPWRELYCDVLYLDGSDDYVEAVNQFLAVEVQHCVVVDDTWQKAIPDYPAMPFYWIGKGATLIPFLQAKGWEIWYENGMAAAFCY